GHQQALARALRMPDHPDFPVSVWTGRGNRALDCVTDGVKLMVARQDLRDTTAVITKDNEVFQEVQETALLEHSLYKRLQLWCARRREGLPRHRSPWHEPLAVCCEGANPSIKPVRNE